MKVESVCHERAAMPFFKMLVFDFGEYAVGEALVLQVGMNQFEKLDLTGLADPPVDDHGALVNFRFPRQEGFIAGLQLVRFLDCDGFDQPRLRFDLAGWRRRIPARFD